MNMTNNALHNKTGLRWLWLAVLAFVLDQASKLAVVKLLPFGYPGVEITPFFNLVHVYNKGAAFSFLADQGGWQRWFFAVLAFAICGLLTHWLRKQSVTQRWSGIAYSLIIGGALGNVLIAWCWATWSIFSTSTGSAPIGLHSTWRTASFSSAQP